MGIFTEIKNFFGGFLIMLVIGIGIIGVGVFVGWITKSPLAGIITVGVIIVGWALFGAIQELIAWIRKTGVYEKNDKEE